MVEWPGHCDRLEEAPCGISRHTVAFVNYSGRLYALKELPPGLAQQEYEHLVQIERLHLPAVMPVGYLRTRNYREETSILVTQYLDRSLPYRSLFMSNSLARYREHLLDAIASLLVQLHVAGIYWGDCSLSNTLFRRDAGALQAYLVDAETAQVYSPPMPPTQRFYDLELMDENIDGELCDLQAEALLGEGISITDTGSYIRLRYQRLWEEISREEILTPQERYRIQDRIRTLNDLGFSVGKVELSDTSGGDYLRLRVVVTDRNFHHDQLLGLTGLEAEEKQARKMMNEIQEVKATLSQANNRSTPLSVAAYHWLEYTYRTVIERLKPVLDDTMDAAELYCQVLEHKWYLSERVQHDVGHLAAVEDYLKYIASMATWR